MTAWWRGGVLYQLYPRSFADSNGDGVGDLRGAIDRLDYVEWLGVDGIWLNPTMPSPNDDWGYDVSDYLGVHPELGTLADLDELIGEAGARNIRVLLDLVPNHTSSEHPWFRDARSSRAARHRDWYVWADPRADGSPPNNWVSTFGGPAWTFDEQTRQYYLHNFLATQPDLNWWNDEVRQAFDEILRFWFQRGVAGFRIDVAHGIVKDRELRDNPPVDDASEWWNRRRGQRPVYNMNRPEVHDVLRRWRAVGDAYEPPRILVGETVVFELESLMAFYGTGHDELHMAFNFPFVHSPFDADVLRAVVEETERLTPPDAWPVWTLSNHDVVRVATRWAGGDEAKMRCALVILLTLRGTAVVYYGDEIGMREVELAHEDVLDPVGKRGWPEERGRDGARTPMQWTADPGAGFTAPTADPWLPLGDHARVNVAAQRADPASTLTLCRDLIALRRSTPELLEGAYESVATPSGVWAWRRGRAIAVAVNLSGAAARVDGLTGSVAVGTRRERDGERADGRLTLEPSEAVVVERRAS